MKYLAVLLVGLVGCKHELPPQNAPVLTIAGDLINPDETTYIRQQCPFNMRTVLPSKEELAAKGWPRNGWVECIPDGGRK